MTFQTGGGGEYLTRVTFSFQTYPLQNLKNKNSKDVQMQFLLIPSVSGLLVHFEIDLKYFIFNTSHPSPTSNNF